MLLPSKVWIDDNTKIFSVYMVYIFCENKDLRSIMFCSPISWFWQLFRFSFRLISHQWLPGAVALSAILSLFLLSPTPLCNCNQSVACPGLRFYFWRPFWSRDHAVEAVALSMRDSDRFGRSFSVFFPELIYSISRLDKVRFHLLFVLLYFLWFVFALYSSLFTTPIVTLISLFCLHCFPLFL